MVNLVQKYSTIKAQIQKYEKCYGRKADSVQLIAISKGQAEEKIRALAGYGQKAFGENYWQEAETKIHALQDLNLTWHYVGRLQSNKLAAIAQHFQWIHSLCHWRHAVQLAKLVKEKKLKLNVLIQVNVNNSPNKEGIVPEELLPFLKKLLTLPELSCRGLMVIPEFHENVQEQIKVFNQIQQLIHKIQRSLWSQRIDKHDKVYKDDLYGFSELSMGMSQDFEAAIAKGATMVRIGTALFGGRTYS